MADRGGFNCDDAGAARQIVPRISRARIEASSFPQLRRITTTTGFIPEVDGFRFLAISSVFVAHLLISYLRGGGHATSAEPMAAWMDLVAHRGVRGVELFFVISGFILSLPFARYFLQSGPPVLLGKFFLRRLTRLEPPYVLSLAIFFTAAYFMSGPAEMPKDEYLTSFIIRTFYLNGLLTGDLASLNGVTWTLEIEVQFYLLMPLLANIFRLSKTVRRPLMLAVMLGMPWIPWESQFAHIQVTAFLHYFIAGLLLADLYLETVEPNRPGQRRNDFAALAALLGIVLWPTSAQHDPKPLCLFIFAFYLCVFRGIWFRRVLGDSRVCVIGGMCYSIYLLHYPILVVLERIVRALDLPVGLLTGFLIFAFIALPVVAAVSTAYFVLIERPCMDSEWPAKLWRNVRVFMNRLAKTVWRSRSRSAVSEPA